MDYLMKDSTIRNYLGGASFGSGLICFAYSSTYDKSFGKWGFGGFLVYLGISFSIFYLIWWLKRIRVPESFQSVVETILCVAICFISVELEKLVPGKSDALSIMSYGLFALMSVSTSRKSELGFETGFFALFLSLFSEQLYNTNWKLFPIVPVFCLVVIFLRHRPRSGSPNSPEQVPLIILPAPETDENHGLEGQNPPEESLSSINNEQNYQEEPSESGQYPSGVGELEVSVESLSSTNSQQNNPDESSQVAHQSPSNNGGVLQESILSILVIRDSQQNNDQEEPRSSFPVTHHSPSISEGSTIDGAHEQNNEQEEDSSSSLPAEYSYSPEQDPVSSGNYTLTIQNGWLYSSPPRQLLRRRSRGMTSGIQVIASRVGDTLGRWRHHVAPTAFLFFF